MAKRKIGKKLGRRVGRRIRQPMDVTPDYSRKRKRGHIGLGLVPRAISYAKTKYAKRRRAAAVKRSGYTMGKNGKGMGSGQMTFITKKYGKRLSSTASNAMKLAKLAEDNIVMRWQRTVPYASATGAYFLDRGNTGIPPANGALENCPYYMFDLSGVAYNKINMTAGDNPVVAYKLQRKWATATGVNPQYSFLELQDGDTYNNVGLTGTWTIEKADDANTLATQVRKDMFSWLDIKMMCIGCTSIPTRFTIELIQLKDDSLHPSVTAETWSGVQTDALFKRRNQFYENEILRNIDGPLATMGNSRNLRKEKKVIHKISFLIQPKTNIELDQEGDYKIIKFFKWINRLQDYKWLQQQTKGYSLDSVQPKVPGTELNTTLTEADTYAVPTDGPNAYNVFNNVELKKRLYLTVKADSFYPGQTTQPTAVPSFDITIRKGHTVESD